jgi:hypothetical protein
VEEYEIKLIYDAKKMNVTEFKMSIIKGKIIRDGSVI